jgi:hypothetical protein
LVTLSPLRERVGVRGMGFMVRGRDRVRGEMETF